MSKLCILTALLGSSTLFYLTKHDERGGRRRPISPCHWPRKFITWTTSGRPRTYTHFKIFLSRVFKEL